MHVARPNYWWSCGGQSVAAGALRLHLFAQDFLASTLVSASRWHLHITTYLLEVSLQRRTHASRSLGLIWFNYCGSFRIIGLDWRLSLGYTQRPFHRLASLIVSFSRAVAMTHIHFFLGHCNTCLLLAAKPRSGRCCWMSAIPNLLLHMFHSANVPSSIATACKSC